MQNYVFFLKCKKATAFQHKRNIDTPELFRSRPLDYMDGTKINQTNFIISPSSVTRSAGPGFTPWHLGGLGSGHISLCTIRSPLAQGLLLGRRKHLLDLSSFCKGEQGTPPITKEFKVSAWSKRGDGGDSVLGQAWNGGWKAPAKEVSQNHKGNHNERNIECSFLLQYFFEDLPCAGTTLRRW